MENKTMAELTSLSHILNQAIIEAGGEITPEIEQLLTDLDIKTKEKVDAYKYAMDKMEIEAEYFKQRAEEFMHVAKGFINSRERLNIILKNRMIVDGSKELLGNDSKFKLVSLKPKMVIDEKFLEDRFYREEVLKKVDRNTIEEAIKQGEAVAGVTLEPVFALRPSINKGSL